MRKKLDIHVYPTMYDIDLIVCTKASAVEEFAKQYTYRNGEPIDIKAIKDWTAVTASCIRKSDKRRALMVYINKIEGDSPIERDVHLTNSIMHEAFHVAMDTWDAIGEELSYNHQEAQAYYVGWIAECIYKSYRHEYSRK